MTHLSHDSYVQKRDEIVPKCINPNCDNNGSIPEQASEDEWVQAQCEHCFTVRFPMLQAIDDLVLSMLGEKDTTFGAQNEAGHISEDDYISYGRNSIREEITAIVQGSQDKTV